jgi:MtrB/PioB family decaheme-associated outer membrane protein
MTSHNRIALPAAALVALAAASVARAEEPTLESLTKQDNSFSAGINAVAGDARWSGMYNGMNHGGVYPTIDGKLSSRDDRTGTWTRLEGDATGHQNGRIKYEYEKQGDWIYSVEAWRGVYANPKIFAANIDGLGSNRNNGGSGRKDEFDLEMKRDNLKVSGTKQFKDDWDVSFSVREEHKSGRRQWGAQGSGTFNFAVEPIEYMTQEYQGSVSFSGKQFQLEMGFLISTFRNSYEVLDTVAAPGGEPQLSLPLDNQAHKLYLNSGFNFTPTTRGTLHASFNRYTQDENYFTQPGLNSRKNLGGKVDNTLVNAGLTSRLTDDLTGRMKLRYEDRDDSTARVLYLPASATRTGYNVPFSRTTRNEDLDFDYRLPSSIKLTAGYGHEQFNRAAPNARQLPWRTQTDENTVRLGLRRPLLDTVSGAIGYSHSERVGTDPLIDGSANLVDPILWANRKRDKLKASMDWSPSNVFTLQFIGEIAQDEYGNRLLGPQEGGYRFASFDGNYKLNDLWDLTGWVSWNESTMQQRTQNSSNVQWQGDLIHRGQAFGLTFTGRPTDELKVIADVTRSDDTSKFNVFSMSGSTTGMGPPLSDIVYKQWIFSLTSDFATAANQGFKVKYGFAHLSAQDWSYLGYTYGDGTVVKIPESENVHFVGLSYYVKW